MFGDVGPFDQRYDREVEVAGESIVAAVVGWNGHDSACSVTGEHIVTYPNWDFFTAERVDGISSGENAGYFFVDHALPFGFVFD